MTELEQKLKGIVDEKDLKLLPENIKKDIKIFGVTGTLEAGIDTSDATATADDIFKEKTAYVDGHKLTGTFDYDECLEKAKQILGTEQIYKEIEYIQSTGTQYIDTLMKINNNNIIEIGFENAGSVSGEDSVIGSRNGTGFGYLLGFYSDGWFMFGYDQKQIGISLLSGKIELKLNKNIVQRKSGDTYTNISTYINNTFTTPTNATLFAERQSGNVTHYSKIKLYYCKIYENNTLIRDFIPVIRYDNVICLFDKVENKFYYNQGTGNFIAGGVV